MTTSKRPQAAAVNASDRSDAIIVSFDSRWYDVIVSGTLSAVIRKRVPTSATPAWLYFHLNSPKSALCARARIETIEVATRAEVHAMHDALALSQTEIDSYCAGRQEIGLYKISGIELAKPPASLASLKRELEYAPPQSFLFLSLAAKNLINKACGFR